MKKRINMQYGPDGGGCGSEGYPRLGKPLFVIGFMGVGKSSIAARLGQLLGVSAREMDDYIEAQVLSLIHIWCGGEGECAPVSWGKVGGACYIIS